MSSVTGTVEAHFDDPETYESFADTQARWVALIDEFMRDPHVGLRPTFQELRLNMPLQSTQLCHIDTIDRSKGQFTVTVHSDDGKQLATFKCSSEGGAVKLRNAIREHADSLHQAKDYSR